MIKTYILHSPISGVRIAGAFGADALLLPALCPPPHTHTHKHAHNPRQLIKRLCLGQLYSCEVPARITSFTNIYRILRWFQIQCRTQSESTAGLRIKNLSCSVNCIQELNLLLFDKYLVDQELGLWKRKWSICSPIDCPDTLASALICLMKSVFLIFSA